MLQLHLFYLKISRTFWPLRSRKITQTLLSFDRVSLRLLVDVIKIGHMFDHGRGRIGITSFMQLSLKMQTIKSCRRNFQNLEDLKVSRDVGFCK